jgi:uncharacterized membrane protein (DUF2068 family)
MGYKVIKGGLQLVLAVVIVVMMHLGLGMDLLWLAEHLRHHARAWSLQLAELLVTASSRRGLWTITVAMIADGSFSLFEAWALSQGHWWGPWIVVAATASLLPFEVVAIVRHPHVVRVVLLALNLLIVWYLARKAMREHRERVAERAARQ